MKAKSQAELQVAAQKAAARTLGAAQRLVVATHMVLVIREKELLDLKGPCSNKDCPLHFAHAGPCTERKEEPNG